MGKALFIVNPVSSGGKTGKLKWPQAESALKANGVEYEVIITEYPGHAIELGRRAALQGRELVVSVGGDGTLNEVGNGILSAHGEGDLPRLGIIPGGRGSDLCRTLGIPVEAEKAVQTIVQGSPRKIDAGLMRYILDGKEEERFFFNVAGLGFDAEVTARANRMPGFLGGTLPYLLSVFIELARFRAKHVRLNVDGEERDLGEVAGVIVANGRSYGGGMLISPHSQVDDGLFHIIVMKKSNRRRLVMNFPKVYKGSHLELPEIEELTGKVIDVQSQERMLLQPDGEVFGETPLHFENVHLALSVMVPGGSSEGG